MHPCTLLIPTTPATQRIEADLAIRARQEEVENLRDADVEDIVAERLKEKMAMMAQLEEEVTERAKYHREDGSFMKEEYDAIQRRADVLEAKKDEIDAYERDAKARILLAAKDYKTQLQDWETQERVSLRDEQEKLWRAFVAMYKSFQAAERDIRAAERAERMTTEQSEQRGYDVIVSFWKLQGKQLGSAVKALLKRELAERQAAEAEASEAWLQITSLRKADANKRLALEEEESKARALIVRQQLQMLGRLAEVLDGEARQRHDVEVSEVRPRGVLRDEERAAWAAVLRAKQEAFRVEHAQRRQRQRRSWVPDGQIVDCEECSKKFGFFRRRHHCRACGGLYCSTCSRVRMALPQHGYDSKVRVCGVCAQHDLWRRDDAAPACLSCGGQFGVLHRRHHCRSCGGIFCGGCCGERVTLLDLGHLDPQRVCRTCAQEERALLEHNGHNWAASDRAQALGLASSFGSEDQLCRNDSLHAPSRATLSVYGTSCASRDSVLSHSQHLAERALRRRDTTAQRRRLRESFRERKQGASPGTSPQPQPTQNPVSPAAETAEGAAAAPAPQTETLAEEVQLPPQAEAVRETAAAPQPSPCAADASPSQPAAAAPAAAAAVTEAAAAAAAETTATPEVQPSGASAAAPSQTGDAAEQGPPVAPSDAASPPLPQQRQDEAPAAAAAAAAEAAPRDEPTAAPQAEQTPAAAAGDADAPQTQPPCPEKPCAADAPAQEGEEPAAAAAAAAVTAEPASPTADACELEEQAPASAQPTPAAADVAAAAADDGAATAEVSVAAAAAAEAAGATAPASAAPASGASAAAPQTSASPVSPGESPTAAATPTGGGVKSTKVMRAVTRTVPVKRLSVVSTNGKPAPVAAPGDGSASSASASPVSGSDKKGASPKQVKRAAKPGGKRVVKRVSKK